MSTSHIFLVVILLTFSLPRRCFSDAPPEPLPSPSPSPVPSGDIPSPSPLHDSHSPPAPAPDLSSSPAPAPDSSPKVSPAPAPANETKTPAPAPVDTKQNTADAGDLEAKDSETGLKSGQKAGIAIGVIAGIAVVGGGVLVYKKRQQNIQRARDYPITYERETTWVYKNFSLERKRQLEDDEERGGAMKATKLSVQKRFVTALSLGMSSPADQSNDGNQDNSDPSSLIDAIGRDNSIDCLIRCSRSDYGAISSLNSSFRSLVRTGELYRLRREKGVVEHWVYFSCQLVEWEAFDPSRHRWMRLPTMNTAECFVFSDKESLAVGTELLVFGKEISSHVIYSYSLLTNTWSTGMSMNAPRCLFGSASLAERAILAGGCDPQGKILNSAELYNSETKTWYTLPNMHKPRKMCSGVFMDGKFYVIGGIGGRGDVKLLTCGEEYDLDTKTWTEIPNMSPVARDAESPVTSEAPPLVAVVNNELYAADYAEMVVRKYNKRNRVWSTVGSLPERAGSMNGWGLAFRACGDRLIVISGPRTHGQGYIEVNSWVPSEGPTEWNLLGRKQSGSFVYNCAVMGC